MKCFLVGALLLVVGNAFADLARVKQPAPDLNVSRIAFGSCAFQSMEQPVFRAVVEAQPDLYLSLGDAIYGDYDIANQTAFDVTPQSLRREWRVLAENPDWQTLVEHVPVMATWDNHDYGHHSAGVDFPLKAESEEIFLDFFADPVASERRKRPGVYTQQLFNSEGRKVQILLLDTRSFKSLPLLAARPDGVGGSLGKYLPNDAPGATLLGQAQWDWVSQQMTQEVDLRIIASSGQVIADQKGMDEWGNYPLERMRLLELIADNPAPTVLLSGNVHFSEVSTLIVSERRIVEFTSSGLTHTNKTYSAVENPYRIAGPYVDESFGLIEIDWQGTDTPVVTLSAMALDGSAAFEHWMTF
ncbi:MAG: alkaline phosphatase D family protein [Halioglobus sp.]